MSWDVLLLDAPPEVVSNGEFPKDFSSNLGSRDRVIAETTSVLPNLDLSTPGWGFLNGGDYYMEIGFGDEDEDPVPCVALHVRGSEKAITVIQAICDHTGWQAFDMTTGAFIQFDNDPAAGYRKWKATRDTYAAKLSERTLDQE